MVMKELASISCSVKGIKFYDGSFSSFNNVLLVREPSNPCDKNSVLVILADKNCEILGHLEGSVAAGIAELMDSFKNQVKVVGYVESVTWKGNNYFVLQYLHLWKSILT